MLPPFKMKLYYFPLSAACRAVLLFCKEAQIPYDAIKVQTKPHSLFLSFCKHTRLYTAPIQFHRIALYFETKLKFTRVLSIENPRI